MTNTALNVILGIIIVFVVIFFLRRKKLQIQKYSYSHKKFFMTRAEHEFFNILVQIVDDSYYIFPQVHLPSIVEYKVIEQSSVGALKHINQKSVDFVLCDKAYISPKLVIELDDITHERDDRKVRDEEVECILRDADLPLLRIKNHGSFNQQEIRTEICKHLEL